MNIRKPPLDRRHPSSFSISRRTDIAFRKSCEEIGVVPSRIVEQVLLDFLRSLGEEKQISESEDKEKIIRLYKHDLENPPNEKQRENRIKWLEEQLEINKLKTD